MAKLTEQQFNKLVDRISENLKDNYREKLTEAEFGGNVTKQGGRWNPDKYRSPEDPKSEAAALEKRKQRYRALLNRINAFEQEYERLYYDAAKRTNNFAADRPLNPNRQAELDKAEAAVKSRIADFSSAMFHEPIDGKFLETLEEWQTMSEGTRAKLTAIIAHSEQEAQKRALGTPRTPEEKIAAEKSRKRIAKDEEARAKEARRKAREQAKKDAPPAAAGAAKDAKATEKVQNANVVAGEKEAKAAEKAARAAEKEKAAARKAETEPGAPIVQKPGAPIVQKPGAPIVTKRKGRRITPANK